MGVIATLIGGGLGLWGWESRRASGPVPQGLLAYSRGDWDQTALLARQRLKEAPNDEDALRLAARAMARQDRNQTAIATYSRLELQRMMAEDYFLLGRALSRTGQDELALKALEAARTADPDRLETLDELAQVYFRKDRPAAAEEIAERLVREPGWETRGQLLLGTCLAARNDPAGAARALRRAFALDPEGKAASPHPVGPLRMLLVRSLLRSGQPAEARRILQAIPGSGSDPESSWLLSRCFLQERAWEPAAAAIERAGSYRDQWPLEPEPAPYVGAAKCGSCHPSNYQSVLASHHATTFSRPRDPESLSLPDHRVADPADPMVSQTFEPGADGIRVETRVGDQVYRALARYAFGSPDHYVTLVGPDDRGRARMLRISSYHSPKGSGLDLTSGVPPHPRDPSDFLGNALIPGDGERRCLGCHTTNFHAIEVQAGPESADHAIGCEACHGPGGNHVLAREANLDDPAIVAPKRAGAKTINGVCARCHGLAHVENITGAVDDPAWLRFQSITMSRSRCYTQSGEALHCVTCHGPHKNAETAPAYYEAKCLSCHGSGKTPCPVNPASGCIVCHMPKTWVQSTHAFKSDHNIRVHARQPAGP
jgi:tetratricopeptide (TPR) repeat protein